MPRTRRQPEAAPAPGGGDLTYIVEGIRHLAVPLDDLVPDPDNARAHEEENLAAIEASLAEFGQDVPVVIQLGTNRIIKGNGRYVAARRLGWTHLAALPVKEESEARLIARAIADNRAGELAAWDEAKLHELLTRIEQDGAGPGLTAVGFSGDQLRKLGERLAEQAVADQVGEAAGEFQGGDGLGRGSDVPDLYAGMKGFQCLLTTQQEIDVRSAVRHAKQRWGLEKTADALHRVCQDYLGRQEVGNGEISP
jgi:hypothetical protein